MVLEHIIKNITLCTSLDGSETYEDLQYIINTVLRNDIEASRLFLDYIADHMPVYEEEPEAYEDYMMYANGSEGNNNSAQAVPDQGGAPQKKEAEGQQGEQQPKQTRPQQRSHLKKEPYSPGRRYNYEELFG